MWSSWLNLLPWAVVQTVQGGGTGSMGDVQEGKAGLVGSGVTVGITPLQGRFLPEEKV